MTVLCTRCANSPATADIRTTEVYFVRREEDAEVAARRIQIRRTGPKGRSGFRSVTVPEILPTDAHKATVRRFGRSHRSAGTPKFSRQGSRRRPNLSANREGGPGRLQQLSSAIYPLDYNADDTAPGKPQSAVVAVERLGPRTPTSHPSTRPTTRLPKGKAIRKKAKLHEGTSRERGHTKFPATARMNSPSTTKKFPRSQLRYPTRHPRRQEWPLPASPKWCRIQP